MTVRQVCYLIGDAFPHRTERTSKVAISFNCEHCGKALTTTDDKAGWKAKCPGCGEVIMVPEPDEAAIRDEDEGDDEIGEGEPPPRETTGAKTCPMCGAENPRRARTCAACGEEFEKSDVEKRQQQGIVFDPGDVVSASWQIYKREFGVVLGAVLIAGIISNMVSAPSIVIGFIQDFQRNQGLDPEPVLELLYWVFFIPAQLVGLFLNIGVNRVLFKVARGKETGIGEIFSGGRYFLRMLGSTLLFALMLMVGFAACIVPGVIVALMFWPFAWVLIDEDSPGIDCLWRARELTRGNWGSAFLLALVGFGLVLLGFAACCIGFIFTFPLAQLLPAVAYCRMTGQRTSELL